MANSLKIRTFIHEQNAFAGLTNKLLERYVEKVFVAFEEAKVHFKNQNKLVVSGNPVRKDFFHADKKECRAKFGISDDEFAVLSFGGSQGAAKINEVMAEALETLSKDEKNVIFFVTGASYYDKILDRVKEKNVNLNEKARILPYIDDMAKCLVACDIVICRAGALAVSEIMVCAVPAILIPSPHVASNHQFFNAKALVDKGGAVMIEEKELDAKRLVETILTLKNDTDALEKMALRSKSAVKSDAVEIIYDNLGIKERI
jgi:UDP-N-acetylglucosamine--N-acetylmuramyl-(pentapeptide) pyrophosphoryl-undecaprenol N-acetylglucosamine transferase